MTTTRDDLQLLYICYFGRPADPGGLSYWLAEGINQSAFSRMVYGQAEFQQTLLNRDIRAQVNSLYLNLFGRNGDSGGLDYWTSAIESGRLNIATLGVDLIYAARQLGNADAITLTAKLSAANAWTDRISENVTLKLNYQPESWLPWDSGAALLSGRSLLSGVTGTTTPLSSTKLDKSLVSVQARSGLPENLAASYSKLNGQAQSLIDPTTLSYYTASAGSVTFSTSEWARYSAKPNWNSSDLGYTHYYYLHSGGDSYSLSSTEQGIWQLLFSDLNSGPQHVLPIRFIPVSNAREAITDCP